MFLKQCEFCFISFINFGEKSYIHLFSNVNGTLMALLTTDSLQISFYCFTKNLFMIEDVDYVDYDKQKYDSVQLPKLIPEPMNISRTGMNKVNR